ncbi:MAG: uroporphyrinogen decarboxylase family protein [Nitrososphaerales archaeon]
MDGRERIFSAYELREPDLTPLNEIMIDPPIVEKITGRKIKGFIGGSLVLNDEADYAYENGVSYALCCEKLDLDAVHIHWYWLRPIGFKYQRDERSVIDEFGIKWAYSTEHKGGGYLGGLIKDEEDYKRWPKPNPYENGHALTIEKSIKGIKSVTKGKKALGVQIHDCFGRSWMRMGMAEFLVALIMKPNFAESLMDEQLNYFIELGKIAIDNGVEVISSGDDIAGNTGPFLNKEMVKRFFIPRWRKFVDSLKKHGAHFVIKHTDGKIDMLMEDFIDVGFDGIHPLEFQNLEESKKLYGDKICLMGRIDNYHVLPYGKEEDVIRDVKASIDALSPGGGHIIQSSNSLHYGCKIENIFTMRDYTRRYGIYPKVS